MRPSMAATQRPRADPQVPAVLEPVLGCAEGEEMKLIRIHLDVWGRIKREMRKGDSANAAVRRLLKLDPPVRKRGGR